MLEQLASVLAELSRSLLNSLLPLHQFLWRKKTSQLRQGPAVCISFTRTTALISLRVRCHVFRYGSKNMVNSLA